ncbi:hypothetical protein [Nostoc sp. MG11]|nr:hypothetical protein [Nostoc sp. MG11]
MGREILDVELCKISNADSSGSSSSLGGDHKITKVIITTHAG